MLVILKGCNFEHTKLSFHFLSFNDECAIVKRSKGRKFGESGIKTNKLQLSLCPSKSTTPVLKRILFQYLKVNLQP